MDLEVDNILENNKKKKIKSGKKGKRVELELVKFLNKRFLSLLSDHKDWGQFSRSIGSGNRWGQNVILPKHAKDTFSGDLTCPANFKFVIESKGGYNDIDLSAAFKTGNKTFDEFLKQVSDDAGRTKRKPLLFWKKDRKDRLAVLKNNEINYNKFNYYMKYNNWVIVLADDLIKEKDEFFFNL